MEEVAVEPPTAEPSSSLSTSLNKTLPVEALNLFLQGKRHLLVQDYKFASDFLSRACEAYAQHFGQMALECGEVYFLYGKALFRLSQQQAGVLGGALNEESTEDEEQENTDEEEENGKNDSDTENSKEAESGDGKAESDKEPSESTDSPKPVVEAEPKDEKESSDSSKPIDEKETSESTGSPKPVVESESKVTVADVDSCKTSAASGPADDAEKSTADDVAAKTEEGQQANEQQEEEFDDLELAWDNLETAKTIYSRQGPDNVDAQLKVADILQLLAEISIESDNNLAAIEDLKASLEIKKKHLQPDDRSLAETYYQMGLAQVPEKQLDSALRNFTQTLQILELRVKNLKETPVEESIGGFEAADREKEIEDLEAVIADIKEKIEDTQELIKDSEKAREELIKRITEAQHEGADAEPKLKSDDSKPVTNITHLLKRKKPDQEEQEREVKKVKLTSVQNGEAEVSK